MNRSEKCKNGCPRGFLRYMQLALWLGLCYKVFVIEKKNIPLRLAYRNGSLTK